MADHKELFSERLNKVMEEKGYPVRGRAVELAKIFQVTPKAAGKWLNAESFPETQKIIEISEYFNISVSWLLTGKSDDIVWRESVNVGESSLASPGYAPVLSWVQAGVWTGMDDVVLTGEEEKFPLLPNASKKSFYLQVKGESNAPDFEDGEWICIDPCFCIEDIQNGEMIVVRWNDMATFKSLIVEPNGYYLKPLNPDWSPQIIPLPEDAVFVGKYAGSYKPPKRYT
ncbi:S24 family peptidase [Acinetobacter bereziniae]|uniref:LexA family protein n=1 Tax=Acinetobacter bereziniae TaxID=106648 RepID=UPI0019047241|nr:S24 family peptidase [Acinetobacter bereziniae]MDG3557041.1 S24 family peptidase [Acinetobacter bereziniae]QQC81728.1 Cro/Cl family transcriptional regulator [Acinetobacter bereziniae]UUN94841.1 Cro/Cl family transcriptional regulator [Acinetobacter bereziniae]